MQAGNSVGIVLQCEAGCSVKGDHYVWCLSSSNGTLHVQFRDLTGFYAPFFSFVMLIVYKSPLIAT